MKRFTKTHRFKGLALLSGSSSLLWAPWALGAQPHLEDAQYDGRRAALAPLTHDFPRKVLTETKALPSTAEALSKYDGVAVASTQMAGEIVKGAQRINPNLLVLRKFNPVGYLGAKSDNPCNNPLNLPFEKEGAATSGCTIYAGHWLYSAGTTLNSSLNASALTVTVANGARITPGNYVVIYDAPAGSFRNAEHALVKSVSGNTVTFAKRGYKSTARPHGAGSIIASHIVAGVAKGVADPLHWMYNLSTVCPKDAGNKQITDALANWIISNYNKNKGTLITGLRVDGILFDTDSWSVARRSEIDANNDLIPDGGWNKATGVNYWGDGSERFYSLVREGLPELLITGGARNVRGFDTLTGIQMEGWPVSGSFFSPNPTYGTLDELFANYTLHLRDGPSLLPAYTENFTKTPTNLYPYGASPRPSSNAPFRFALGTTLLDDGYFAQESESTVRDPWWDEFAVTVNGFAVASDPRNESSARANGGWLGRPLGPRKRVYSDTAFAIDKSLLKNGGLDTLAAVQSFKGTNVTLAFDAANKIAGAGSAKVSRHIRYANSKSGASVKTPTISLKGGVDYTLAFSIRSENGKIREVDVGIAGKTQSFKVPDRFVRRVVNFTPKSSGSYAVSFNLGEENVGIWLDDVYVFEGTTNVLTREFEGGLVVVNATAKSRTVALGKTFRRIKGTGQDPINNGASVTSVTLAPYDAAILVRPPR